MADLKNSADQPHSIVNLAYKVRCPKCHSEDIVLAYEQTQYHDVKAWHPGHKYYIVEDAENPGGTDGHRIECNGCGRDITNTLSLEYTGEPHGGPNYEYEGSSGYDDLVVVEPPVKAEDL